MVTAENCINLIKEKFPKFCSYWDMYIQDFGADLGLTIQMLSFGRYVLDVIKSNNEDEIIRVFEFVEFLFLNGDETVQNAVATGFLEYLMNKSPEEVKFSTFYKYMGENAIGYCRAWDEFNGAKTEGLWDKE
jgi:hypothetical protein